ncbi:FAD-linked oxidoreductase [Aureobasidium sp. EXF-3400]|nr:FAD-linked oxidoreductase [Aureobasidium sp. EXF-12344]KAI4768518.1 FAD-linked oxidoreductase [Aureobasidium sp. EXF-3400]
MQTYIRTNYTGSSLRTGRVHVTASIRGGRTFSHGKTQLRVLRPDSTLLTSRLRSDTPTKPSGRTLQAIPTTKLVRSLVVLSATAVPAKVLAFLIRMTKKHVDTIESINPLRWTFKKLLYDNFCIGCRKDEILTKTRELRRIGFTGIVLANAREAQPTMDANVGSVVGDAQCEEWLENNLKSVQQAEPGDYVGLRFTGAGTAAAKFLSDFSAAYRSHSLEEAINTYSLEMEYYVSQVNKICAAAEKRQVRILIDAESSTYQKAIDCVALIMASFNTASRALVLNTYQMYLRSNIDKLKLHLDHSVKHGYVLGIKMVRGAYLHTELDKQSLHVSKRQTDEAYDAAVQFLLQQDEMVPWKVDIMLATHNAQSVCKAFDIFTTTQTAPNQNDLSESHIRGLTFSQLMGMADEVSMDLVNKIGIAKKGESSRHLTEMDSTNVFPRLGVYQYTAWGSLRDCLLYILRRAEENKDAVARTQDTAFAVMRELRYRVSGGY